MVPIIEIQLAVALKWFLNETTKVKGLVPINKQTDKENFN